MRRAGRSSVVALACWALGLVCTAAAPVVSTATQKPIVGLRQGTSSNWSGYAAFGSAGGFTRVSASWTQPSVSCSGQDTYSSYWVGLDGYNSSTVEQLGTEADCSGGAARYYAWFEMYPRPGYLVGVTVRPGDTYRASVGYIGAGRYSLGLTDTTTGQSFSTTQKLQSAKRSSAEVIVEAPWSGGVLPLANFGTVNFSGSLANDSPLGGFANLDPITMQNPYGMKATPSGFDATKQSFSVNWSAS